MGYFARCNWRPGEEFRHCRIVLVEEIRRLTMNSLSFTESISIISNRVYDDL